MTVVPSATTVGPVNDAAAMVGVGTVVTVHVGAGVTTPAVSSAEATPAVLKTLRVNVVAAPVVAVPAVTVAPVIVTGLAPLAVETFVVVLDAFV